MSAWAKPLQIQPGGSDNSNNAPPPQVVSFGPPSITVAATAGGSQQQQPARCRANDSQLRVFLRGIDAVLQQWTALNLVCRDANGEHNPEAALSMRDDIRKWFGDVGEVFSDELEDYFYEFFETDKFASVEDGSIKEVADAVHEMYRRCCNNDDSSVVSFENSLAQYKQSNTLGECVNFGGDEERGGGGGGDDSDDDYCDNEDAAAFVARVVESGAVREVGDGGADAAMAAFHGNDNDDDDTEGSGGGGGYAHQMELDADGAPLSSHNNNDGDALSKARRGGGGGWKQTQ